jgi:hypothetical protein
MVLLGVAPRYPKPDKTNENASSISYGRHGFFCRVNSAGRRQHFKRYSRSRKISSHEPIADQARADGRAREEAGSRSAEAACRSSKAPRRRSGSAGRETSDAAGGYKTAGARCPTGSKPSSSVPTRCSGTRAAAGPTRRTKPTARCASGCTRTAIYCPRSGRCAAAGRANYSAWRTARRAGPATCRSIRSSLTASRSGAGTSARCTKRTARCASVGTRTAACCSGSPRRAAVCASDTVCRTKWCHPAGRNCAQHAASTTPALWRADTLGTASATDRARGGRSRHHSAISARTASAADGRVARRTSSNHRR